MEITPELKDARRYAGIRLAKAASALREADDQLVALGKELRHTPTGVNATTFERDGELAVARCNAVAGAYAEMRAAEAAFEALDPSGNPLR